MSFFGLLNQLPSQFCVRRSDGGKRIFAPGTFQILASRTNEESTPITDQPDDFEALLEEHTTGCIWLISARYIEEKEPPDFIYRGQLLSPNELAKLVIDRDFLLPPEVWGRLKFYGCAEDVNVRVAQESVHRQLNWFAASILARVREVTGSKQDHLVVFPRRVENLICGLTLKLIDVLQASDHQEEAKTLFVAIGKFHESVSGAVMNLNESDKQSDISSSLSTTLGISIIEYSDNGRIFKAHRTFEDDVGPTLERLISMDTPEWQDVGSKHESEPRTVGHGADISGLLGFADDKDGTPDRDREGRSLTSDEQKLLFCRCYAYFDSDQGRMGELFEAVFEEPMEKSDGCVDEPKEELKNALLAAKLEVEARDYYLLFAYIVRQQKVSYRQIGQLLSWLKLANVKKDGKQVREFAKSRGLTICKRDGVNNFVGSTKVKLAKMLSE